MNGASSWDRTPPAPRGPRLFRERLLAFWWYFFSSRAGFVGTALISREILRKNISFHHEACPIVRHVEEKQAVRARGNAFEKALMIRIVRSERTATISMR